MPTANGLGSGASELGAQDARTRALYVLTLVGVAALYFILAKSGLKLASINPNITPVWPASGFALAAVLLSSAAAEQERPAGAWHAEWQALRTLLRLAGGAAERTVGLVEGLVLDPDAMRRNLDQLRDAVGEDDAWVGRHIAHVDVWVDRVLARHRDVRG